MFILSIYIKQRDMLAGCVLFLMVSVKCVCLEHHSPIQSLCTEFYPSAAVAQCHIQWACWLIGRFGAFRPMDRRLKSRSSRHVETLGKSFTRSCLWRLGVKFRHSIRAVSEAPLSRSGLEEALLK